MLDFTTPANRMIIVINESNGHLEWNEGFDLGQIKYIVNCTEWTAEGIQATYRDYKWDVLETGAGLP